MPSLMHAWWLVGLGIIPLIRWLHRRQAPLSTHLVSALFLWRSRAIEEDAGQSQRPPDSAWRRRAFFVTLLFVALASPIIDSEVDSVVVWIDLSPSMQVIENGETRLAAAERALDRALSDQGKVRFSTRQLIDALPKKLDKQHRNWLVTDGANDRIREWAQTSDLDRVIQSGTSTDNSAVTQLSIRRNMNDSEMLQVLVSASHEGESGVERILSIFDNDRLLETFVLRLEPGQTVHRQTSVEVNVTALSASLSPEDVLREDDQLSVPVEYLRPLRVVIAEPCPRRLQTALALHPALSTAPTSTSAELLVTCGTETAGVSSTPPESVFGARIHFVQGDSSPVATEPVWFPQAGLSGALQIPTDHLRAIPWPEPLDTATHETVLLAGTEPLILMSRSPDGRESIVETVVDFQNTEFAKQPAYAGVVATLVDIAFGRNALDPVVRQSRDVKDIVIRPQTIPIRKPANTDLQNNAGTHLYEPLLLISIFVIALDALLLLLLRRKARNA